MNSSEYKISLDIHEINSQHLLYCKQGDTQRKIIATLVEESELYHIAEDCTAVFTAFKPDGKVIFNQAHIVGDTIVYEFTEQTSNVSGKLDCELRLYGYDNGLITSPRFTLIAHPTVYVDVVESKDEVNVLTALISEATELIDSVNTKLNNGEFIPRLSIGTVTTLPAGSNATAEFTGTGEAPVLNLGIPQGDEGQAESLIPDSVLSEDSTKPVQNKVIATALKTLSQETENKLETKVDKAEGMGLSANSFTDAEKEKLAGIEAGANKYVLEANAVTYSKILDGAVGTTKIADTAVTRAKLADAAVTRAKLADTAVSQTFTGTLLASGWTTTAWGAYQQLTFAGSGIIAYSSAAANNQHIEVGLNTSAFATNENPNAIEADEAWANIFRAIPLNNGVQFNFKEVPTVDIPVYAWVVNK